tara:strand:- start:3546 stop:3818 length:273 start_codon:yes stop_codon:yes gene_type:complete
VKIKVLEKTTIIVVTDAILALGLITPFFSQSIITSPKTGKEVSQECTLGELFENRNAANIKNGVVGITGSNAPIMPRRTHTQPRTKSTVL